MKPISDKNLLALRNNPRSNKLVLRLLDTIDDRNRQIGLLQAENARLEGLVSKTQAEEEQEEPKSRPAVALAKPASRKPLSESEFILSMNEWSKRNKRKPVNWGTWGYGNQMEGPDGRPGNPPEGPQVCGRDVLPREAVGEIPGPAKASESDRQG